MPFSVRAAGFASMLASCLSAAACSRSPAARPAQGAREAGVVAARAADAGAAGALPTGFVFPNVGIDLSERHPSGRVAFGTVQVAGGTVATNDVALALRRYSNAIRGCYERSMRNNPSLEGRVEMRFVIEPSGRVVSPPSVVGVAAEPAIATCIAGLLRRIVFPAPVGGPAEVIVPATFSAGPS